VFSLEGLSEDVVQYMKGCEHPTRAVCRRQNYPKPRQNSSRITPNNPFPHSVIVGGDREIVNARTAAQPALDSVSDYRRKPQLEDP